MLIVSNNTVVATLDDADDPRMFRHMGKNWVLNNNYYRTSLLELHRNGSPGRELRVPITQSKNLVPISWSFKHFFLMDIQDKLLWPAQLDDKVAVLLKRPLPLTIERSDQGWCQAPRGCIHRGGTQGLHLRYTDQLAYGAGHCTGSVRTRLG